MCYVFRVILVSTGGTGCFLENYEKNEMKRTKVTKLSFKPKPRPFSPDPMAIEAASRRRSCIRGTIITSVVFAVLAAILTVFASGVVPEQYVAPLRAIPAFNVTDIAVLAEIASFASDAAKSSFSSFFNDLQISQSKKQQNKTNLIQTRVHRFPSF